MSTTVKVNLSPVSTILNNHGLQKGGKAQLFMTSEIHRVSMPYIPFDNNPLSTNVTIETDSITYNSPYAQYQWHGVAMEGNPKVATNRPLKYQGGPKRGKEWTNRAMADHKQEVIDSVEKFIKEGR